MGFARKMERRLARESAKNAANPAALLKQMQTLPQALEALKSVSEQLNDTQSALVHALREINAMDFEQRRQRAVSLRMVMEIARNPGRFQRNPDFVAGMLEAEEAIRAEYDTVWALVSAFSPLEEEAPPTEKET